GDGVVTAECLQGVIAWCADQRISAFRWHIGPVGGHPGLERCRVPHCPVRKVELFDTVIWRQEIILYGDLVAGACEAQDEVVLVLGHEQLLREDSCGKLNGIHWRKEILVMVQNHILTGPAGKAVGVQTPVGCISDEIYECIITGAALICIITETAIKGIVPRAAEQGIAPTISPEPIIACLTRQYIGRVIALQLVITVIPREI